MLTDSIVKLNHKGHSWMKMPTEKLRILLIDDDSNMHIICKKVIEKAGYEFLSAANGEIGLEVLLREQVDLVLLDYMMPGMDGFNVFKTLRHSPEFARLRNIPVVMLSVLSENHPKKKQLLEMGLSLYLNKPFGGKELVNIVENLFVTEKIQTRRRELEARRLLQAKQVASENRELRKRLQHDECMNGIVGNNPKMTAIFDRIKKVAQTDANILISGESGTGKELVAQAIHNCSRRSNAAFVPIDCVALPGTLIESELFGYEKGAFTGAMQAKKGLLEIAHKGTFFMDEITELHPDLQAKLLRVLQERQFRHLGGKELISVDIRVIAATNRQPFQAVKDGILRQDLYYRLNVIPIHLPALRERPDDIPLLVQHFLRKFSRRLGRRNMVISDEVERTLVNYQWPGNIRELQNVVERIVSLANGRTIAADDLPEYIRENDHHDSTLDVSSLSLRDARRRWMECFEKKYLVDLLKECRGNISEVARRAGINRMTVYRMLKQYKINLRINVE